MLNVIDVLFLIFTYITLYFAVLFLLIFSKKRKNMDDYPKKGLKKVSIIIPAYNEEKTIAATIKSVKAMLYPDGMKEIIVVDDGSSDNTYKIAKKFSGVKVLKKKNQGRKAFALNYAIKHVTGSIIACVDADAYPEKNALLKTIPYFSDPKVASVTTTIFAKKTKNILERLQRLDYLAVAWSRKLLEHIDSIFATPGPMSLYRTDVLKKLRGFDTKNLTEDIEIAWRLQEKGYKIKMSPARVYTCVPKKVNIFWKQRLRWNMGGVQTMKKYKHTLFKKKYEGLGIFITPFFFSSMVLSFIAVIMMVYLIVVHVSNFLMSSIMIFSSGANPFVFQGMFYIPNVFTIFGILVFVITLAIIKLNLKTFGIKAGGLKGFVDILIYMSLYFTIFPLLFIHALWRLVRKKHEW